MLDRLTERTGVAGLERYEVSAYARPGHRCVHNLNYWEFGDYLGIGAGAHSKLSFAHRIVRQVRYREPRLYMDNALAGMALAQDDEVPRAELPFEFMLNALRLREGFSLQQFCERTGLAVSAIASGLEAAQAGKRPDRARPGAGPTDRARVRLPQRPAVAFSLKDWNAGQPAWALSTESIWSTDCAMV